MNTIVMLLSLIAVVATFGRHSDTDTAEGNENDNTDRTSLPPAQDPKEGRSHLLLYSRRILSGMTNRLLVAIQWLTDRTAPTALMNKCAVMLESHRDDLQEIHAEMSRAGVHAILYGMYPQRIENQLREAAKAGRKWAMLLCGYYSKQVICSITNKVADMRDICSATQSGIMATIRTEWDENAAEYGAEVEVGRGRNVTGSVAMDWIMSQTNKATWETALAFLQNYRGRQYGHHDRAQRKFAVSVIEAFNTAEEAEVEATFQAKVVEYGYAE